MRTQWSHCTSTPWWGSLPNTVVPFPGQWSNVSLFLPTVAWRVQPSPFLKSITFTHVYRLYKIQLKLMALHFSFSRYCHWLLICFATLENPLTYFPIQKLTLLSQCDWFRSMWLDQSMRIRSHWLSWRCIFSWMTYKKKSKKKAWSK